MMTSMPIDCLSEYSGPVEAWFSHRMCGCTVLLAAMAFSPPGAKAQTPQAPRLELTAQLFNAVTGSFSPDVLAGGGIPLGNVVAGPYASNATLVVVRVAFGHLAPLPRMARVRLVARERHANAARVLIDQTARLGPIASDGTTYLGFWLAMNGCRPIELTARLVGGQLAASTQAWLNFACYE